MNPGPLCVNNVDPAEAGSSGEESSMGFSNGA